MALYLGENKVAGNMVSSDTGWVNLSLNSGVSAATSKYRKVDNMVTVVITNLTGYSLGQVFATLPASIRPKYGFRCLCPSSGASFARLEVYNNDGNPGSGSTYSDRIGAMLIFNNSSGGTNWVDINITYSV